MSHGRSRSTNHIIEHQTGNGVLKEYGSRDEIFGQLFDFNKVQHFKPNQQKPLIERDLPESFFNPNLNNKTINSSTNNINNITNTNNNNNNNNINKNNNNTNHHHHSQQQHAAPIPAPRSIVNQVTQVNHSRVYSTPVTRSEPNNQADINWHVHLHPQYQQQHHQHQQQQQQLQQQQQQQRQQQLQQQQQHQHQSQPYQPTQQRLQHQHHQGIHHHQQQQHQQQHQQQVPPLPPTKQEQIAPQMHQSPQHQHQQHHLSQHQLHHQLQPLPQSQQQQPLHTPQPPLSFHKHGHTQSAPYVYNSNGNSNYLHIRQTSNDSGVSPCAYWNGSQQSLPDANINQDNQDMELPTYLAQTMTLTELNPEIVGEELMAIENSPILDEFKL